MTAHTSFKKHTAQGSTGIAICHPCPIMCGMKTGALQRGAYGFYTQISPMALCAYMCQPSLLSGAEGR